MSAWIGRVSRDVRPADSAPPWVWEQFARQLEDRAVDLRPSNRAAMWRRVGSQRWYWQRDVWYELRARRGWRGRWIRKRRLS